MKLSAEFSLVSPFFELKKVGFNPTFHCFGANKVASYEKIAIGKTAIRSSMSTRILKILSKYPPHTAFNFETMK